MKRTTLIFILGLLTISLSGTAQNADIDLLKSINPQYPNSDYWKLTSGSAYVLSVGVPAAILIDGFIKNDPLIKRKSLEVFGAIIAELVISEGIKYSINRQRPGEKYPNIIFPYQDLHGPSFPSGHSSMFLQLQPAFPFNIRNGMLHCPLICGRDLLVIQECI